MSKLTDNLTDLINDKMQPEITVGYGNIKRNYESNKYNDQPFWIGYGMRYTSFLRYDTIIFNGRDTVANCVKIGIKITHIYGNYYDVTTN